ncbi:MAG: hypothetical protein IIC90_10255 [Chloroflexi bacterium]|nr:hypothetical protein [Chloroflexota bacterium]
MNGTPPIFARLRDPYYRQAMKDIVSMERALVKAAGAQVDLSLKAFFQVEEAMYLRSVAERTAAINKSMKDMRSAFTNEQNSFDDAQFDAALQLTLNAMNQMNKLRRNAGVVQAAYEELKTGFEQRYGAAAAEQMIEALKPFEWATLTSAMDSVRDDWPGLTWPSTSQPVAAGRAAAMSRVGLAPF